MLGVKVFMRGCFGVKIIVVVLNKVFGWVVKILIVGLGEVVKLIWVFLECLI